ncbi:MAG: DUF1214 domain-containing protein [Acidimicrobiales bacterium]
MQSEEPANTLLSWSEQMQLLSPLGEELMSVWRPEGATASEIQDMNKLVLSMLASGYFCRVYTDESRPVFMPVWNYACNQGGPDPDYVYSTTEVDHSGVYQISGFRGTSRFVEITQQSYDILNVSYLRGQNPVPITHDLDDLRLDDSGAFSVVLSSVRPNGYTGDWWKLETTTRRLLMRRCSCDWINEIDARVAIERIDLNGGDMSAAEISRRFSEMAEWIRGTIEFDMGLVRHYREHHGINTFLRSTKIDSIGGLPTQAYYDGIHEINDDEALILETELPNTSRYWQALVADDRFCTVDWVNRQSSLNDSQATIDSDGRVRFVISRQDPGVPNWLDKADLPWGVIQMRLNHASSFPDPTLIKVPVARIREYLPADTPVVTNEQRQESLRLRRQGAQLRRIW